MIPTPVFFYGLGPIGQQIARMVAERSDLRIVGAVDINPSLAGKTLGELLNLPNLPVKVVSDLAQVDAPTGSVALHATGSSLEKIAVQFSALIARGYDVVSTCEELAYPYFHNKKVADELHAAAVKADVSLLGTGVNPGFAMDTLPLALTAPSRSVERVRVERRVAAGQRREPLQRKIGASLTQEQFEAGVKAKTIRHVGLPESVAAIAGGLGWKVDKIEEVIEPVLATEQIKTQYLTVEPGQVAGVHQVARGFEAGRERILLELTMSVSVPVSVDKTFLEGTPNLSMTLEGLHGDIATAAIAINAVASVRVARAGLVTMVDVPVVHR
ncbi:MAG: NAD(P)H-dependent amine dehydrogenase family protein [Myxococcaceae bacterium]